MVSGSRQLLISLKRTGGECRDSAEDVSKLDALCWKSKIYSHGRVRGPQGAASLQQLLNGLGVWLNRICHLSTGNRPSYVCEARQLL